MGDFRDSYMEYIGIDDIEIDDIEVDERTIEFYNQLCIPTITELLKDVFFPQKKGGDIGGRNTSLNISEGQLYDFATDVLFSKLMFDIQRLANTDPAAANKHNPKAVYVWETYKGLKAVMYYRVANQLIDLNNNCLMPSQSDYFSSESNYAAYAGVMFRKAKEISMKAATETTIEINPSAIVGKGFVIDHGIGTKVAPGDFPGYSTVIGETCVIGENCTLLNSVLLGAKVINQADKPNEGTSTGPRHPRLGNNVTICAGVRILGYTRVGDNVTVGPCCVITEDIPNDYVVTVVNQLQFTRQNKEIHKVDKEGNLHLFTDNVHEYPVIEGLTINSNGNLVLFGERLNHCNLDVVTLDDGKEAVISSLNFEIISTTQNSIEFKIIPNGVSPELYSIKNFSLRIIFIDQGFPDCDFILERPYALRQYLKKITNV